MSELRRVTLALALIAYANNTVRNLFQQHVLLQQNKPRLPLFDHICAALKYTFLGQLIASSEYLLCFIKPQLAARIGHLLLRKPQDCRVNCRYGSHERNTLDVYGVDEGVAKPVLIFMHGGAWSFGHKWQYALVGKYLATQGFQVVVMNYRTFPNGSVMDMIEDVENAVFWVAENCHLLGGNPCKLFLSGHSSGGHVAALALLKSGLRLAGNDKKAVKEKEIGNYVHGFIGLAAPYDVLDHYTFESERIVGPLKGVHEISSMKPAMLGVGNFEKHSPTELVKEARNRAFSLPTFYLLHGDNDMVVPSSASKKFAVNLRKAGQIAVYCEVPNCTHEDMAFAMMGDPVDCREDIIKLLKWILFAPVCTAETTGFCSPIPSSPRPLASKL
ncbi:unnamed protein product [Peronospora belbahrii]|uniref:BD-FAE-like domain-containing protein n=1 Tax=Peronospora belbahrii TaxID=622444 RepID=A0AAU9KZV7_9STRA|nr:unnamed protein product [Peronospora belbahrii]CAH0514367.1 unnamed protein product [Peronospora belbahrii]